MACATNSLPRRTVLFFASGTGLGYFPVASGTFGTLWGLPIAYGISHIAIRSQIFLLVGSILVAVFLAAQSEKILGRKDPSQVVADEIVGYMTALMGLPFSWTLALIGFLLFRCMDIVKPFPIRAIDRGLPGGWGIVLDDVLAGVYCQLLLRLWISWG